MPPTLPLRTPLSRKAFSVQVRDYLDLCVTRLADLKGQAETGRCKENETGQDRTPGVGKSINSETCNVDGDYGDPTTREVNYSTFAVEMPRSHSEVHEQSGVLFHLDMNQRVDILVASRVVGRRAPAIEAAFGARTCDTVLGFGADGFHRTLILCLLRRGVKYFSSSVLTITFLPSPRHPLFRRSASSCGNSSRLERCHWR